MSDGVLDLLVLILCIAILVPIGASAIIPIAEEYNISQNVEIGDKTAPTLKGELNASNYEPNLTALEVVLTTQVQDYCMPEPRKLSIPNPNCPNEANHFKTPEEARNVGGGGCYDTSVKGTPNCPDTIVIDITSMYRPDILAYGNLVYTALTTTYKFPKYYIEVSYGRYDVDGDESYRVRKAE